MGARKKDKEPKPEPPLNPKQELFCRYYAQSGDFFGNATLSYAEAYDYELETLSDEPEYALDAEGKSFSIPNEYDRAYKVCSVEANRLLGNPRVQARITILLNELLKDTVVDSQLAKLIMQDGDNTNKIAGIREYNKLRGRIIDKSQDVSRLPFGESDLSAVIATLPQERQDFFYGIINQLIDEAELLRSTGASEIGFAR
jgi:hypothetical protein